MFWESRSLRSEGERSDLNIVILGLLIKRSRSKLKERILWLVTIMIDLHTIKQRI